MEFDKMSENLQRIIVQALNEAKSKQHSSVDTIDILEAIFKEDTLNGLFDRLNVDKKQALQIIAQEEANIVKSNSANLNFSNEVHKCGNIMDCTDVQSVLYFPKTCSNF
mgnify:CR=1 FL=1